MPPSQGASFLAGAAASAALIYLYQNLYGSNTTQTRSTKSKKDVSSSPPQTATHTSEKLLDSCALDQRMIRKAEGAILNRTSRLIVVVERCTNDHNYSAILRTVEALGVQNVYIISPQCIQSTLTNNNDMTGDNKEEIDEDVKLKRSSGQVLKRATEAEIKDRSMHHLYARKATEWLTVTDFDDTKSCIDTLRKDGYQIWATDLGQAALCLTEEDLRAQADADDRLIPAKLAIVFGTELWLYS